MPRLKLRQLPAYSHSQRQLVRVTDVNYGGHLATSALVGIIHQARVELLQMMGCSERDLGDGRTGLIQTDMALTLHGEAFLRDELEIDSEVTELKNNTFRMCHAVRREGILLALAEMGFAGFCYKQRRLAALPETFRVRIRNFFSATA
jgi:acyl-CoA thioester hydrolase